MPTTAELIAMATRPSRPSDAVRARLAPYDAEEAVFVDEICWATEEEIHLRRIQPDRPDPVWQRAQALAHRVLHAAHKRLERIREQRLRRGEERGPAVASSVAAQAREILATSDAPSPAPAAPVDPIPVAPAAERPAPIPPPETEIDSRTDTENAEPETTQAEPESWVSDIGLVPSIDPRRVLLLKTGEPIDTYAGQLAAGHSPNDLLAMEPTLDQRDLEVIVAAISAGLHHPIEPGQIPAGLPVHKHPACHRMLELVRALRRAALPSLAATG